MTALLPDSVPLALRKEFLRDGALNAMWRAKGAADAVSSIENAIQVGGVGLAPDKLTARNQFLVLAKAFMEKELEAQMLRALEELKAWEAEPNP